MSPKLAGHCAVITGGNGSIGKAIAHQMLEEGAEVILTGRSIEKLQETKTSLLESLPDALVGCYRCDVSIEADVVALFQSIEKDHSIEKLLLVNNAGTFVPGSTVDTSGKDFDLVMQVNVTGAFLCAREALKRMIPNQGGRIINIGSISAIAPRPNSCSYTTSKFALLGMTKSLALDARPHNVAVGIIHPGNVRSALWPPDAVSNAETKEGFQSARDVAQCVLAMATLPYSVNVLEMTVLPTRQPLIGRG